jgi:hypothetical protein
VIAAALLLALGTDPGPALELGLPERPPGPKRAQWASQVLLGMPFAKSPLGEGNGSDGDPRFRLDAFDCVTYVETVMALGNASNTQQARLLMDDIRYDGPADFAHRNHYMMAQWVPANVRKGWLEDITTAVAGPVAVSTSKRYTKATWAAAEKAGHILKDLPPERRPMGTFQFPIVPLEELGEVMNRIPAGTVLLVVREDRPWRPYRVTHMGVVTVRKGVRYLRHASDVPSVMRVRDEPLEKFLERNARYQGWPVSGVSLFGIRANPDRVRSITLERRARL